MGVLCEKGVNNKVGGVEWGGGWLCCVLRMLALFGVKFSWIKVSIFFSGEGGEVLSGVSFFFRDLGRYIIRL